MPRRLSVARRLGPVGPLAAVLLLVAAAPLSGQNRLDRDGFWLGFGLGPGYAFFDCDACGPRGMDEVWEGGTGASFYFALGGAARTNLILGGMLEGWGREDDPLQSAMGSLSFIAQYYPVRGSGFYLRPGMGIGGARLESPDLDLESKGVVGSLGLGYDVRVGRRFALSPHLAIFQGFSEGTRVETLTGTFAGPDFPRYATFAVGFHWY